MKIPITKPYFDEKEYFEVKESLENGWLVQGPKVKKFEEGFSHYTGIKYAKATCSCTTALHLGLIALGVKEGQDVIVPSFTFIATPNSVRYTGAEVVFCDVDIKTYNLDPEKLEKTIYERYASQEGKIINKKTGNILTVILTVHQFGLASPLKEINRIAEKFGLAVMEDGACGIGARINDIHVGNFGNICAFSFHPRKSITTGEGGMVTTNCEKEAELFEALRSHGATISDLQRHEKGGYLLPEFNTLGYNYRLTDIQGGIGIEQLKKLKMIIDKKHEIADKYKELLKPLPMLISPYIPEGYKHGYQSFVYRLDNDYYGITIEEANKRRNDLMKYLENEGIATRQGTHACHTLGYYKNRYNLKNHDLINSYKADRLSIALPMFYTMKEEEIEYVVSKIKTRLL